MKTRTLGAIWLWLTAILLATAITRTTAQSDPLEAWQLRASDNTSDVAYGNGVFVVGDSFSGIFLTSPDGINWTRYISPFRVAFRRIVFAAGSFFAIGPSPTASTNTIIVTSSDGQTWTQVYETTGVLRDAAAGNGRLVFVGEKIVTTPTGAGAWREFPAYMTCQGVTFGSGRFVATAAGGDPNAGPSSIISSSDGSVWRVDYGPIQPLILGGISFGSNVFLASWTTNGHYLTQQFPYGAGFIASTNLQTWQPVRVTNDWTYNFINPGRVTYGGGQFIGIVGSCAYSSSNGYDWVRRPKPLSPQGIAFGQGTFVAAGGFSGIWQSGPLPPQQAPPAAQLTIAAFAGLDIQGTAGHAYRIESTTDLQPPQTWQAVTNLFLPFSPYRWIDASSPATGKKFYRAIQID